jgi:hypothetical protein
MPTNVELAIKLAGSYHQSQVVEVARFGRS